MEAAEADAAEAVVVLLDGEMEEVLARADALRVSGPDFEELRRVLSLPIERRLQAQIRAASDLGDELRKFTLEMRMKGEGSRFRLLIPGCICGFSRYHGVNLLLL